MALVSDLPFEVKIEESINVSDYDAILFVASSKSDNGGAGEIFKAVNNARKVAKATQNEGDAIRNSSPLNRIVFVNIEHEDIGSFGEIGKQIISRAFQTRVESPLLVFSFNKDDPYGQLVTLLGVIEALKNFKHRQDESENSFEIKRLGLISAQPDTLRNLISTCSALGNTRKCPRNKEIEKQPVEDNPKKSQANYLDFSRLDITVLPLSPTDVYLRRNFYAVWANEQPLKQLFRNVIQQVNSFFQTYFLKLDDTRGGEDVLISLSKPPEHQRLSENTANSSSISVPIRIYDYPVHSPISVSNEVLSNHNRTAATSELSYIGYQHVYIPKYEYEYVADSSNSDSSSSEDEPKSPSPKRRRTQQCQKTKLLNSLQGLPYHKDNSTELAPNRTKADVLIFCPSSDFCSELAEFLGVINLDYCLDDNGELNRDLNFYILDSLIDGCNNICVTSKTQLFLSVEANVKAAIFTKKGNVYDECGIPKYVSLGAYVEEEKNILHFIAAISAIINKILKVKSSVEAVFLVDEEKQKYCNVEFPLFCTIPFYILRYFAQVVISKSENEYSYSCV